MSGDAIKRFEVALERRRIRLWFEARRLKNITDSGLFLPLVPMEDTNKMLADALARGKK